VGAGLVHSLVRCGEDLRRRWRVVATDCDPFSWGLYVADAGELVPRADAPGYIPAMRRLIRKHGVEAILPGSQAEAQVLMEHRERLAPAVVVSNRPALFPLMMQKFALAPTLRALGVPFIESRPLPEWRPLARRHGWPLVLKPSSNTSGSRGLALVQNARELRSAARGMGPAREVVVQPYVGSPLQEYTVGVLCDREGNLIDSIVMRRHLGGLSLLLERRIRGRRFAVSTGQSQGYFVKRPAIQRFCEALALKLRSVGPLNVQLRLAHGRPLVFDLHPRFSGTTALRADAGFNEADLLLRSFLDGDRPGRVRHRVNCAAIRAYEHVLVPRPRFRCPASCC
jgi:carbamoyl-phosphate synthase large subunit